MNEKIDQYLNGVFASYEGVKSVSELRTDLLSDLNERFNELRAGGKDEETALLMTLESIGDIEKTVLEVANLSRSLERQVLTNFSASNLPGSDFAGVCVPGGKFEGSELRGSDFSGADLSGSSLKGSSLREANFDGANLTDCNLTSLDLRDAHFNKSILVRTNFSKSGLDGVSFLNAALTDVDLSMTDLRKARFENCVFDGVDFKYADLGGLCLDGQTFLNVKFDKAALHDVTFQGSVLKNVSFLTPTFTLSKKYYRAVKAIRFDGAVMDKLTFAALKGIGADLTKVTVMKD